MVPVVVVMLPDPVPVPVAPLSELAERPAVEEPLELQLLNVPPPAALSPAAPDMRPSEASLPCRHPEHAV